MRGRSFLALAALALCTAAAPVCVASCDCAGPSDLRAASDAADAVFAGTSLGFRLVGEDTVRFRAPFRVLAVWKGDVPADAVVWSDVSDCAMAFSQDDHYLVFATRDGAGRLTTRRCVGTQLLADAGDGVDVLGSPREPAPAAAGAP
jgi:hypothetical protein